MSDELEPQQWVKAIHGPYVAHDNGRQIIIIVFLDGGKKTKPYARYLVEQALGRELDPDKETVDHFDRDVTNNELSNFRILPRSDHIRDDVPHAQLVDMSCPRCNAPLQVTIRKLRYLEKHGSAGPFCGRHCAGKHNREVQLGRCDPAPPVVVPAIASSFLIEKTCRETVADLVAALPEQPRPLWREVPKPPKPEQVPRYCAVCGAALAPEQKITCSELCKAKNQRRCVHPSKEELRRLVWEMPQTSIAKRYGISDVAVAKWCKKYEIEKPPRGYWARAK